MNVINGITSAEEARRYGDAGLRPQEVEEEFLTIFYKELLRQTIKTPDLSVGLDEDDKESRANSVMRSFSSDVLIERLALELAQQNKIWP